jgi:hypothetical protein
MKRVEKTTDIYCQLLYIDIMASIRPKNLIWKSDTSGMTFKYLSITQYFYQGNETGEFSSLMKRTAITR